MVRSVLVYMTRNVDQELIKDRISYHLFLFFFFRLMTCLFMIYLQYIIKSLKPVKQRVFRFFFYLGRKMIKQWNISFAVYVFRLYGGFWSGPIVSNTINKIRVRDEPRTEITIKLSRNLVMGSSYSRVGFISGTAPQNQC